MEEAKILTVNEAEDYLSQGIDYQNQEEAKSYFMPAFISVVYVAAMIMFFVSACMLLVTQILAKDIGADLIVVKSFLIALASSAIMAGFITFMEKNLFELDKIYHIQMKIVGMISGVGIVLISLVQYIMDKTGFEMARSNQLLVSGVFLAFIVLIAVSGKHVME